LSIATLIPIVQFFIVRAPLSWGQQIEVKKNLSKPLSFIGLAYANKGVYAKSAEYHERAIEVAIDQQDSVQLGFGYNNLGRMYFDGGDLVRASDNLVRSRDIFEVTAGEVRS
jgi:tetratricopeptide (TPR) repeat protein